MISEITALHISTEHMDARTWLVFGLLLGGPLVLLVWTGIRVHREPREAPDVADLGFTAEDRGSDESRRLRDAPPGSYPLLDPDGDLPPVQ